MGEEVQLQRLSALFFDGRPEPTKDDADFPRRLTPREQRHTNLTEQEVKSAVMQVLQPLRETIPTPTKNGGLKSAKGKGPAVAAARIQLEESSARARRCKGSGAWTSESKELARVHHLVTGSVVFLMPEVMWRNMWLSMLRELTIAGSTV